MNRVDDERGQALPLVTVVLVIAGLILMGVIRLGTDAVASARARTEADAAALALAGGGSATRLGVEVEGVERRGNDVEVTVGSPTGPVVARARRVEALALRRDLQGLAPAMVAAVLRAEQLLGRELPISSGYRSRADQQRLWDRRDTNPYPVARPGTSRHERGLAIDVPSWFVPTLRAVAADAGLCSPLPETDPVHFELCRT